jgi:putative aldouronate transport system substrate-binding protein
MNRSIRTLAAALTAACVAAGAFAEGGAEGGAAKPGTAKPELRLLNIWQQTDYNTYPVAKMLEEQTGYKVAYDMLPQDSFQDKLNLLIASGEPYDIVTLNGDNLSKALVADYAKRGALTDLTPLLDAYGPNIRSGIAQASFDALRVDGKVYAIPNVAQNFVTVDIIIRQDWLDKVGLKAPKTLDEFVAVLRAFKEKDPGTLGDANIPFTTNVAFVDNIAGAFGVTNEWNERKGKLVPRWDEPSLRNYVEFMAKLYAEGLIDKEFPINKAATVKEKFSSGRAGAMIIAWWDVPPIVDALAKTVPNAKIAYLMPLQSAGGVSGLSCSAGFDRFTFIPKASKHPKDAMIWMNMKMDKELFRFLTIGKENVHFTIKDGDYYPILPIFTDERNMAHNYLTGTDEKMYPIYWQARVRKDPRLYDAWAFMNKTVPKDQRIINVLGLAPSLPEYAKNNQQLGSKLYDGVMKAIVTGDTRELFGTTIPALKVDGGDAVTKEVNAWYATYKAGKK